MFERHVGDRMAALLDGELPPADATRAQAHLATCARCQAAAERVQFAGTMLSQLRVVEAPASIWASIETALDAQVTAGFSVEPASSSSRGWRFPFDIVWSPTPIALAVAAVLVAVVGTMWWRLDRGPASWEVVRLDVAGANAPIAPGEWIETGAASQARIKIGEIGTVDIAPNTRMQVLTARRDQHRLNLARGRISAEIAAPPRLFFVETPTSTVVDLGCAYTMEVDEAGVGLLRVTQGWASLEWEDRESIVPAGASCPTRPVVGPGTPAFDDASARLKAALLEIDFGKGGDDVLSVVLAEARPRDTLTLWHLLPRVDDAQRVRVFERMVEFAPLPKGVTRERVLARDRETLELWRQELAWTW